MTTPDTTTELDDQLLEAIEEAVRQDDAYATEILTVITPVVAAIRRQASADALNEQARSLGKTGAFMREQARAVANKGKRGDSVIYDSTADGYFAAVVRLKQAAADKIAEGYEWQCASGTGCCSPVPDAGDLCKECEAAEYDDRWAE